MKVYNLNKQLQQQPWRLKMEEQKGSATLPKEHYEKTMDNVATGGSKYSTDNVAELNEKTKGLASFVKSKKNSK